MKWFYDPFRNFLFLSLVILVLGSVLLFFAKDSAERWYEEISAHALIEGEAANLEVIWYLDGIDEAKKYISENKSKVYSYDIEPVDSKSVPEEYLLDEQGKPVSEFPSKEYLITDSFEETDSYISLSMFFDHEENWYKVKVSILKDFFHNQFSTLNKVFLLLVLLFVAGLIITGLSIMLIKNRLVQTNKELKSIRNSNNLSLRLSTERLSGSLYETISQMNLMLQAIEHQVEITRSQASNIAHDLRTPLTVAYQNICLLQERYPELELTEQSVRHLLSTFNILLKINRIESKGEPIPLTALSLKNVIDEVLGLYQPALDEKEQNIEIDIVQELNVLGHFELLFQIVCNILDNSLKYNEEKSCIRIRASRDKSVVKLVFSDQGGGVSEEFLPKLFDKFYRVDHSRHQQGNGLGLSFVKATVEALHGKVTAHNTVIDNQKGLSIVINLKGVRKSN